MEVWQIISAILTVLAALFGGFLGDAKAFIKDLKEFLQLTYEIIEDNNVSPEEWNEWRNAAIELWQQLSNKAARKEAVRKMRRVKDKKYLRQSKG